MRLIAVVAPRRSGGVIAFEPFTLPSKRGHDFASAGLKPGQL